MCLAWEASTTSGFVLRREPTVGWLHGVARGPEVLVDTLDADQDSPAFQGKYAWGHPVCSLYASIFSAE